MPIDALLMVLVIMMVAEGAAVVVLARRMRLLAVTVRTLRALQFDEPGSVEQTTAPSDEHRVIRRYTVFQQGSDGARAAIYSGTDRKLAKRLFTDMAVVPGGEVTCEADGQALWRRMA